MWWDSHYLVVSIVIKSALNLFHKYSSYNFMEYLIVVIQAFKIASHPDCTVWILNHLELVIEIKKQLELGISTKVSGP